MKIADFTLEKTSRICYNKDNKRGQIKDIERR